MTGILGGFFGYSGAQNNSSVPTGLIWGVGYNAQSQLGVPNTTSSRTTLATAGSTNNWTSITAGSAHSMAIDSSGNLWGWGYNFYGQLGIGSFGGSVATPTQTVSGTWSRVSATGSETFGIKTDGTLWACGYNGSGSLGINSSATTSVATFTQIAGGGTTWSVLPINSGSGAIKTDGTLWNWGSKSQGQCGDGTTSNRSSPVQISGGGTNWKSMSKGTTNCALKTDGTLWMWGSQVLDGTTSSRLSPVQVAGGGTNWASISSYGYFAGIKTDGTLWVGGFTNTSGQLGTNNTSTYSSPVTIAGGGTTWSQVINNINTGTASTVALKTDGSLWSWGYNVFGQLGTGNTSTYSSPVTMITTHTAWTQIAVGVDFTLIID